MTGDRQRTIASHSLDPVTFEVLRNAFISTVDQMAEQILRTCHSFVIYARDFSSALCDKHGDIVAQGNQDGAAHVGTLHFTAKAVIAAFEDDIHPGDVYVVNDPYLGGTHFSDVRVIRPIFAGEELIGFAQSNGHWADIGGTVPGSFDVRAKEHFGEGLRIPPVRMWGKGTYRKDLARLIVSNVRAPNDSEGDLHAQAEATRVAEQEVLRLVEKYGLDTVLRAFTAVQDYVEIVTRQRVAELDDGVWEGEDYLDSDPGMGEGLIPVRVKMEIRGDEIHYDLEGSHPVIASLYNSAFGGSFSGVVCGTKFFFPDLPLNSGFYRVLNVDLGPEGTVVNARWPAAVTGFLFPYEKIVNVLIEMWSSIMPERAMACSFNSEYLQIGGRDLRGDEARVFMWYDWLNGGWGGRNGKDGANATTGLFTGNLECQPVEGQERLSPALHTEWQLMTDSGGPGKFRGGLGVRKSVRMAAMEDAVISYVCDRGRSIVWGIDGGLPSCPHGLELARSDGEKPEHLGVAFAGVPVEEGDSFSRPSSGGGGYGDPLDREPARVAEDVADGYVSFERAKTDYGVILDQAGPESADYTVQVAATERERQGIRRLRRGWLTEDPEDVSRRYRAGELESLDLVRMYGVILDWSTGALLPKTTQQFREMLVRRAAAFWRDDGASSGRPDAEKDGAEKSKK